MEKYFRYAITVKPKFGTRTFFRGNQGHNHFLTQEEANAYLQAVKENNTPERIDSIFGFGSYDRLRVDKVETYHHGDAKDARFYDGPFIVVSESVGKWRIYTYDESVYELFKSLGKFLGGIVWVEKLDGETRDQFCERLINVLPEGEYDFG